MPSPFLKDDKPSKPEKPAKPEKPEAASKDKPFSLPAVPVEFMPPADKHPRRLVAVTDSSDEVLSLAFSDGKNWYAVLLGDVIPSVPEAPEEEGAE